MQDTSSQYDAIIEKCRALYVNKMKDYSSAWRIFRLPSITDQIYIKAQRIRMLEIKKTQRINEDIPGEYIGIINYSVMALIQLEKGFVEQPDMGLETASQLYDEKIAVTKKLMLDKNHDYGEAWRTIRVSSITDLILQKILRIKQMEDNDGKTVASEGFEANYQDIINYAAFALILLEENQGKHQK